MSLITLNLDLDRCASALERIAIALERLSPPPLPTPRTHPRAIPEPPRPPRQRQIMLDLIAQGLPRDQALALSKQSDLELMRKGIAIHPEAENSYLDPEGDLDLSFESGELDL